MAEKEEWVPKTREDFVELYADGITLARSRQEEADAKASQAQADADKSKDNEGAPPKRTLREILLGA
jgi:elongation factor P--beta-lysine ligase